jgi:cathepsin X
VKDTWTEGVTHKTTDEEKADTRNDSVIYDFPQPTFSNNEEFMTVSSGCRVPEAYFPEGEVKTSPHAWDLVTDDELPAVVDWRDMNGKNYVSWNKNQHIPRYCGSCWAQGTTSALADRFNIMYNLMTPTPVALDAQVIVNCQAGGSCDGGNPGGVYHYARVNGIPHSSCEQYTAYNLVDRMCEDIDICRDCTWPPPAEGDDGLDGCWAVEHKKYYVSEHYSVSGVKQMKAELYKNGPMGCGIHATTNFEENYKGGIYSEHVRFPLINHEISVVGYGVDENGTEYWIGRNSWGTYWGEYGFFKMQMYKDNLGIETNCIAATPSATKVEDPTQMLIQ